MRGGEGATPTTSYTVGSGGGRGGISKVDRILLSVVTGSDRDRLLETRSAKLRFWRPATRKRLSPRVVGGTVVEVTAVPERVCQDRQAILAHRTRFASLLSAGGRGLLDGVALSLKRARPHDRSLAGPRLTMTSLPPYPSQCLHTLDTPARCRESPAPSTSGCTLMRIGAHVQTSEPAGFAGA